MSEATHTAQEIVNIFNAYRLHSALVLTGAKTRSLVAVAADENGKIELGWEEGKTVTLENIRYGGLKFQPNVKARGVYFYVVLNGKDLFDIYLITTKKSGASVKIYAEANDIYNDNLNDMVDELYTNYCNDVQDGFIFLS